MSLQQAAASYIYIHYTSKKKRKERRVLTCHVARPDLLRPIPYHSFDTTAKYQQHTEQARNVNRVTNF